MYLSSSCSDLKWWHDLRVGQKELNYFLEVRIMKHTIAKITKALALTVGSSLYLSVFPFCCASRGRVSSDLCAQMSQNQKLN